MLCRKWGNAQPDHGAYAAWEMSRVLRYIAILLYGIHVEAKGKPQEDARAMRSNSLPRYQKDCKKSGRFGTAFCSGFFYNRINKGTPHTQPKRCSFTATYPAAYIGQTASR